MDLTSHSSASTTFKENEHCNNVLARLHDQTVIGRFCDVTIHVKDKTYLAHRCVLASCSAYFESLLKDKNSVMEDININSSQHEIFKVVLDYMYTGKVIIDENTVGEILRMANYFSVLKLKGYCSEYLERNLHTGNCYFVKEIADKWDLPKLSKTAHAFILANIAQVVDQQEVIKFDEQRMDNLLGNKSLPMTEDLRFHVICNWITADVMSRYKFFDKFMLHIQWPRMNIQTLYNLVQSEKLFAESEWCMYRILSMLQDRGLLLQVYMESLKFLANKVERGENIEATFERREAEKLGTKEKEEAKRAEAEAELEARKTLQASENQGKSSDIPTDLPGLMDITANDDADDDDVGNDDLSSEPSDSENMNLLAKRTVDKSSSGKFVKLEPENAAEKSESENEDFEPIAEDDTPTEEFGTVNESCELNLIVVKPKEEPKHKRKGQPVKLRIRKSRITAIDAPKKRGRPPADGRGSKKGRKSAVVGSKNENDNPDAGLRNPLKTKIARLRGKSEIEMDARNIVNVLEAKWQHDNDEDDEVESEPSCTVKRKTPRLPDEVRTVPKPKKAKAIKAKRKPRTPRSESKSPRKSKDKEERCEHCSYLADDESSLFAHMENCEQANNVTHACNICTYSTPWNKLYHKHMKTHFKGPPYRCDFEGCDYTNERIQPLLYHRMRHTDERPYSCSVCEYRFRTKNNLQTHMRCHTGEKPWMCEVCNRCFATKGTLEQHSVTHSEIRPYLCDTCGFSTKYQSHLIAHKRIHTGDVFKCQFTGCKYSTPKRSQLACHMRSHMSIRQHICAVCSRAFVEKSHLVRHERIHLEDKPFKCTNCDYSSTRRDKLKEHVEKYHGEGSKCKTPYKPRKSRRPNQNDAHLFAYCQTTQREAMEREFNEQMEKAVQMNMCNKQLTSQVQTKRENAPEPAPTTTKEESPTAETDMTQLKAAILNSTPSDLTSLTLPSTSQSTQDIIIQAAMSSAISTAVSQANENSSNIIPITLDHNSQNLLVTNPLAAFAVDPRLMQTQNLAMIGAQSQATPLVVNADSQDGSAQLHGFQVAPVPGAQNQQPASTTDLAQLHGLMGMFGNMANI